MMPDWRHSDRHSQAIQDEGDRYGPQVRTMEPVKRIQVVGDNEQEQEDKSGEGARCGRQPDLIPREPAKRRLD